VAVRLGVAEVIERKEQDTAQPAVGMRVGELISALQAHGPECLVVVEGQNEGFVGVTALSVAGLKLNANAHPDFGPHEIAERGDADVTAVVLRGH